MASLDPLDFLQVCEAFEVWHKGRLNLLAEYEKHCQEVLAITEMKHLQGLAKKEDLIMVEKRLLKAKLLVGLAGHFKDDDVLPSDYQYPRFYKKKHYEGTSFQGTRSVLRRLRELAVKLETDFYDATEDSVFMHYPFASSSSSESASPKNEKGFHDTSEAREAPAAPTQTPLSAGIGVGQTSNQNKNPLKEKITPSPEIDMHFDAVPTNAAVDPASISSDSGGTFFKRFERMKNEAGISKCTGVKMCASNPKPFSPVQAGINPQVKKKVKKGSS